MKIPVDIILTEDDIEDVFIFKSVLEDIEVMHTLRHAENAEKLFMLLKNKIPYLLFLDINMPCTDGITCIAQIRKQKEYDHLPIIIYTSHPPGTFAENSIINGANYYLSKPDTYRQLTNELKEIFSIDWKARMQSFG